MVLSVCLALHSLWYRPQFSTPFSPLSPSLRDERSAFNPWTVYPPKNFIISKSWFNERLNSSYVCVLSMPAAFSDNTKDQLLRKQQIGYSSLLLNHNNITDILITKFIGYVSKYVLLLCSLFLLHCTLWSSGVAHHKVIHCSPAEISWRNLCWP
jgi:hypothetical protein